MQSIFVLCSQSGMGLGWPESAHRTLESAKAAAEPHFGQPLEWIPDPQQPHTWITLFPDDWMIREVELHGGRSPGGNRSIPDALAVMRSHRSRSSSSGVRRVERRMLDSRPGPIVSPACTGTTVLRPSGCHRK
jgi:hypothetical protein